MAQYSCSSYHCISVENYKAVECECCCKCEGGFGCLCKECNHLGIFQCIAEGCLCCQSDLAVRDEVSGE